eukprot:TRINITY_DN1656_c0_g2_i1.p1 TRINITY_DN1656_c0_g2~~TRINITY_DN1656_c0_g2_i1.p1  ORF type:complete len:928 (+),score=333.41 TRINITY_DN1656_c0_g2_i1:1306-4089(+)
MESDGSKEFVVNYGQVAVGCNRNVQQASWARNGLVAYAAGWLVAVFRPEEGSVRATLSGHGSRVNAVCWLPPDDEHADDAETELVSAASDGVIIAWRLARDGWQRQATLLGHSGSVTSLGCLRSAQRQHGSSSSTMLLASSSADGTVKLWSRPAASSPASPASPASHHDLHAAAGTNGGWQLAQSLSFAPGVIMECVALTQLPSAAAGAGGVTLLAVGGVLSAIQLFVAAQPPAPAAAAGHQQAVQMVPLLRLEGHLDWLRCLAFARFEPHPAPAGLDGQQQQPHRSAAGHVLLASASQDGKVRLWRFEPLPAAADDDQQQQPPAGAAARGQRETAATRLSSKGHVFRVGVHRYSVMLESVLSGHDGWVLSVAWHPPRRRPDRSVEQPAVLVSASMDKTMIIWRPVLLADQPDHHHQQQVVWHDDVHLGALGGDALGFYGAVFSPSGDRLLAHSFTGALHLWQATSSTDTSQGSSNTPMVWAPQVTVSGHAAAVTDCAWQPDGAYLVSVSEDRTARLWAPWVRPGATGNSSCSWHEIARPQLHGHNIECICFVASERHCFVSGADEKVLRVFDAPRTFVDTLAAVSRRPQHAADRERRVHGAAVPPLGLSNKPLYAHAAAHHQQQQSMPSDVADSDRSRAPAPLDDDADDGVGTAAGPPAPEPSVHERPPLEEHLIQSTVWPELHKLYGHPNEIVAVACNRRGSLIASACKASSAEQAAIRLWDTRSWKQVAVLTGHTLSVVQLEFSHDDSMLASVSRDRQLCVFEPTADGSWRLGERHKAHGRIVWSCDWAADDSRLATGSRDKTGKVWRVCGASRQAPRLVPDSAPPPFASGVTAVAWAPAAAFRQWPYVLAVGEESGHVSLWTLRDVGWTALVGCAGVSLSHVDAVRRLRWRPLPAADAADAATTPVLASCSSDGTLRFSHFAQ